MRVGIVNDTAIAMEALRRIIAAVPDFEIAWLARDGEQALLRTAEDLPDIILMDLYMPVMDGVESTRRIMASNPCAILIVTASVEGNASKVFEALGAGAVDSMPTPVLADGARAADGASLVAKIRTIGRLTGKSHVPASVISQWIATAPGPPAIDGEAQVVVIGCSAGGPPALAEIVHQLPVDFPPVVIVQHIDAEFASGMAEWLNGHSPIPVHLAYAGESLSPGNIYVAGTGNHLVFTGPRTVGYSPPVDDAIYCPCIDVCLLSLLRHLRGRVAAAILTGMGRDGAAGLKALRAAGAYTIAQDRWTSAVFGMPKAAAEMNAAEAVLPLSEIVPAMVKYFARERANA